MDQRVPFKHKEKRKKEKKVSLLVNKSVTFIKKFISATFNHFYFLAVGRL